jgi:hypothetical protein
MKNIAPGLSLKKYKGNKHEQGGIMVNALGNKTKDINKAVAEVEGGEYNYRYDSTNPNNNYILSAQLVEPAKIAKQADTFKNNDRISYNTRNNLLNKSVKLNEVLKAQKEQSQMQMQQAALGGMLKKYKNGSFLLKGSQSIVDSMVANSKQNDTTKIATAPEIKLGTTTAPKLETNPIALPTLPTTTPKTTAEAANTGMQVNTQNEATPEPVIEKNKKNNLKGALSSVAGAVSALGPIGQGVGTAMQLAPYAIDLGKAMFDKTSVQDLQTQGSAMKLPNTTYAKNGGKLNVKPLPKFDDGTNINKDRNPFDKIEKKEGLLNSEQINLQELITNPFNRRGTGDPYNLNPARKITSSLELLNPKSDFNRKQSGTPFYEYPFNPSKTDIPVTTPDDKTNTGKNKGNTGKGKSTPVVNNNLSASDIRIREAFKTGSNTLTTLPLPTTIKSNTTGITNFATLDVKNEMDIAKRAGLNPLDVVEPPKQKDKLSEMLKSGLMLKGSAMAGSLFSALQPAQKETLRLPDFGRADDAMSRATAFSMNPALNEVEQARGKSQEAIRNMATTAGQLTSNLQSVNQRAGQQSAGLRVQEQQIMNQLAAQKAGYETQKASAIQQELARFDENTLMNKAATQDARVAFVENINNLGTEIMKQGNEQDIANQQDKLAVQNAKLKIIQSAFENPDVISGANLESILKMIEKGDYTNIPKLFGQTSDTRKTLKAEADRVAALQNNK